MKAYIFDADIAVKYGVDNAIMIWNLAHWIEHNSANEKNFFNGRYWTYNSIEAYTKIFPFWSKGQIRRVLKSLEESGVIMTGNFNADRRDRSTWYAFTDEFLQLHLSKSENAIVEIGKRIDIEDINEHISIPDKNTNSAAGGGLFQESEFENIPRRRKTSEALCLFENSAFSDFDKFKAEFDRPEFAGIDIAYYFHAVADWSAQKGKKMKDWIATARNFIRGDIERGKLHRVSGTTGLSPDALKYLQDMA